jgi:hypothetical protein
VWAAEVTKSYAEDTNCKELIQQLGVAPTSLPNHTFSKGLLRYKNKIYVDSTTDLRAKLIDSLHNSELGIILEKRQLMRELNCFFTGQV